MIPVPSFEPTLAGYSHDTTGDSISVVLSRKGTSYEVPDFLRSALSSTVATCLYPVARMASAYSKIPMDKLLTNTEAYIRGGGFDQDRMLEAFEQLARGGSKGGFPLSRICCRMDWAVEDRSYVDELVDFELRVNDVRGRHDDAVICTYHLGKFGGDTVIDIMRTHPLVIIGGILESNLFFVPPGGFRREVRESRARRTTSTSTAD